MVLMVSKHIEGHYEVEVAEPHETWVKTLASNLLCDETTALSLALGRGLIDLMLMCGRLGKPEGAKE